MRTLAFFGNQGGVGRTTLVYHLAWMLAELGHQVVAADVDPHAGLTAMFLDDDPLAELWERGAGSTIDGALAALRHGTGDIEPASLLELHDRLALLPGDVRLSSFEDELAESWVQCLAGSRRGYRVMSSISRVLALAAAQRSADFMLVDVGSNLGAINRAALLSADHIVIPVAADLFSIVGLRSLGPTLSTWRSEWQRRLSVAPSDPDVPLPRGPLSPLGYVTMPSPGHGAGRTSKVHDRWLSRIPAAYRTFVLAREGEAPASVDEDPECLAVIRRYDSLMAMAQEARKPIFRLTPADGALGSHSFAVRDAYRDFEQLARALVDRSGHEA